MRKLKKPVSILLSAMLIISLFTIIPFNVSAAENISYVNTAFKASDLTLYASLSGSEYGSYAVSVNNGEPVSISTDGSVTVGADVKEGDTITVTFTPAENGRINEFYTEGSDHIENHHENEDLSNGFTFEMPAETTLIHTGFANFNPTEVVEYLDENGDKQTATAKVLTGERPHLRKRQHLPSRQCAHHHRLRQDLQSADQDIRRHLEFVQ